MDRFGISLKGKPLKVAIKNIENEQLTMSDLLCNRLKIKFELEKQGSESAIHLSTCLEVRRKSFFGSNAFLAGIPLDPLTRGMLSDDNKKKSYKASGKFI